jgi:hypothetical protein
MLKMERINNEKINKIQKRNVREQIMQKFTISFKENPHMVIMKLVAQTYKNTIHVLQEPIKKLVVRELRIKKEDFRTRSDTNQNAQVQSFVFSCKTHAQH